MNIKNAEFIISNTDYKSCPAPQLPEYAFIGRSNVGKSSLINALANNNKLAKTSATPGKTQLINHFLINNTWYLVDLPGYGFAKTSKTKRANFEEMISQYLIYRTNLVCLFVLIDSRHKAQLIDQEFMQWLAIQKIAFAIVFTKGDKLGKNTPEITKDSRNPSIVKINGARRGLFILNFFILLSQDSVLFFSALRPYQQF